MFGFVEIKHFEPQILHFFHHMLGKIPRNMPILLLHFHIMIEKKEWVSNVK